MKEFRERINYIKGADGFSGYPVNLPMICGSGETVEELEQNMRETVMVVLEHLIEEFGKPFEMHEVHDLQTWLHGEEEAKLRSELARYKEIYGDL